MRESKFNTLHQFRMNKEYHKIRDVWISMQHPVVTSETSNFTKDLIYRIDPELDSVLAGCLVFCIQNFYNQIPTWHTVKVPNVEEGLIVFSQGIMSPHFRLVLTSDELNSIDLEDYPINAEFNPWENTTNESQLIIDDYEIKQILLPLGYPFMDIEELPYNLRDICDLMIKPALDQYFSYHPIRLYQAYPSSSSFKIEMPPNAFGVLQIKVTNGLSGVNPNTLSALAITTSNFPRNNNVSLIPRNFRGFRDLNSFNTSMYEMSNKQSKANILTRENYNIVNELDPKTLLRKKYLQGYSNRGGTLEVTWALVSNNWDDIEYEHKIDARNLASANILENIYFLYSQEASNIDGRAEVSWMKDKADSIKEQVLTKWKQANMMVGISGRGTL